MNIQLAQAIIGVACLLGFTALTAAVAIQGRRNAKRNNLMQKKQKPRDPASDNSQRFSPYDEPYES